MPMISKLIDYLSYSFVQNALLAGILISLCASLLGTVLVLKKYSFIGESLSRTSFCAAAIASILKMTTNLPIILIITIMVSFVLIMYGNKHKSDNEAVVAMVAVSSLAIGYILINKFSGSANVSGDVCTVLFGSTSILTLSTTDVWICVGLSIAVVVFCILFHNYIFGISFEETFMNTVIYDAAIAVISAIVIVLAMNLVGSLLVTALIVFPTLTAMKLFNSFKAVTIAAAVIAVLSSGFGIIASILMSTPVGSTIVIFDLILFILAAIFGKIRNH